MRIKSMKILLKEIRNYLYWNYIAYPKIIKEFHEKAYYHLNYCYAGVGYRHIYMNYKDKTYKIIVHDSGYVDDKLKNVNDSSDIIQLPEPLLNEFVDIWNNLIYKFHTVK